MNKCIIYIICFLATQNILSIRNITEMNHSPTQVKIVNHTNQLVITFSFSKNNSEIKGVQLDPHTNAQYMHTYAPVAFGLTFIRDLPNSMTLNSSTLTLTNASLANMQRLTIQIYENTPDLELPQNILVHPIPEANLILTIKKNEEE